MTGNWTPGPWEVSENPMDNQDYKTLVVLPSPSGIPGTWVAAAEHNWNDAEAGEHRISWKEAEANALLIAAAPELAEALLLAYQSRYGWEQKARAALVKAGVNPSAKPMSPNDECGDDE